MKDPEERAAGALGHEYTEPIGENRYFDQQRGWAVEDGAEMNILDKVNDNLRDAGGGSLPPGPRPWVMLT